MHPACRYTMVIPIGRDRHVDAVVATRLDVTPDPVDRLTVDVGDALTFFCAGDVRVKANHVDAHLGQEPGMGGHVFVAHSITVIDDGPKPNGLAVAADKAVAIRRKLYEPMFPRAALVEISQIKKRSVRELIGGWLKVPRVPVRIHRWILDRGRCGVGRRPGDW